MRMQLPEEIATPGVIAVLRKPAMAVGGVAEALRRGGIRAVEVASNTPDAAGAIGSIAAAYPDLLVGAGTVTRVDQAATYVDAGAQFVLTPTLVPEVIAWCVEHEILVIPGGHTPTEVATAWDHGATAVKVFPASTGGPPHVAALQGPFPSMRLVPVGGVTAENAGDFIRAGSVAVGVGGWLTALADATAIADRATRLATCIRNARRNP